MILSVRLDPETRKLLARLARTRRLSRSEVIRRGIRLLAAQDPATLQSNPYEQLRHLIGRVSGGPPNLSERTGERFRNMLVERKGRK
jgi:hypothetical protein